MTSLEGRYRRLLGVYPADHREAYEQEMLGVLMAGSRPGQRFPAPGEALDLLRTGFLVRIGRGGRGLRSNVWQDACAVIGLLAAVVLLAVAGRRLFLGARRVWTGGDPMRAYGIDGFLLLDVLLRTTVWLAVVIAIGIGLRRAAAGLGVAALVVEFGAQAAWFTRDQTLAFQGPWLRAMIVLCVGALLVSIPGRPAVRVLGRRGVAMSGAGLLVAVLGSMLQRSWVEDGDWLWVFNISYDGFLGVPVPLALLAGALLLAGIRCAPKPIWRRMLVLVATALAVPAAQIFVLGLLPIPYDQFALQAVAFAGVLIIVPFVTFAFGLLILRRREGVAA